MRKWNREEGRVDFVSTQVWRMSQDKDTKSLNLGKDLDEIPDVTRKMKDESASDDSRLWKQQESTNLLLESFAEKKWTTR